MRLTVQEPKSVPTFMGHELKTGCIYKHLKTGDIVMCIKPLDDIDWGEYDPVINLTNGYGSYSSINSYYEPWNGTVALTDD